MLWRDISNLFVKKVLKLGKGATVQVTSSAGVVSTIDMAELAAIDSIGAADLAKIDGITNGTALADKALVLGASKEISVITTLGATTVNVGASSAAGDINVFPSTAAKGKLHITKSDNTNNDTTVLNVALQAQSGTITIPDPGAAAAFVALSTSAMTTTEVNVLHTVTPGTLTASKAMIADANSAINIIRTANVKVGTAGSETDLTVPVVCIYSPVTITQGAMFASRKWMVDSIVCRPEISAASAATMVFYKAASGTSGMGSGVALNSGSFDLQSAARTNYTMELTGSTAAITIATGDVIGWVLTGATETGKGSITFNMKPI